MKRNTLLTATIILPLLVASCVPMYHPPRPIGPRTGVSLDDGPNGERSARQTRFLEQEYVPPPTIQDGQVTVMTGPDTGIVADPNAPAEPTSPLYTSPVTTGTTPPPPERPVEKPSAPAPAADLQYGSPVPGKKGFVYSPFDKSAGFVDVRDIAPGTKVRCPYTGKIFKVP